MHPLLKQGSPWQLVEMGTDEQVIKSNETLFALSNGHIGTRGNLEEGKFTPTYLHNAGTYMNGFHEIAPIDYSEWAFGYAANHQTMSPLPNAKQIRFAVNGEWFDLEHGTTTQHKRILDMEKGLLTRSFVWENSHHDKIAVVIERFVSFDVPELLAQHVQITPLTADIELKIETVLDDLADMGKSVTPEGKPDPRVKEHTERSFTSRQLTEQPFPMLHIENPKSGMHAVVGTGTQVDQAEATQAGSTETWTIQAQKDEAIKLTRFAAYSSFYFDDDETIHKATAVRSILETALADGYDHLKAHHLGTMKQFWEQSDIVIEGDDDLQKGLRFNLFHLNQAAGRDGLTNMSAKGLTGPGYEGHYFWDTEMYMLPFFIYTQPETAKQLLLYRHSILPKAKERAREMAIHQGVLFPWRTINGEEASAYFPAGTAQFHINADIAYAVYTYIKATGDMDFAYHEGLEILVETARFWVAFGHHDSRRKAFVINDVTGPDEYTALVNNNFYTNLMAQHNLDYAVEMVLQVLSEKKGSAKAVLNHLDFDLEELAEWTKASEAMYLPYDHERKLTQQDDSFFDKSVWDFEATPLENHPLLLHYHPLTIYRHQVNKQADTVLAELLFSWEFSAAQKKRDYEYYESVTTHDSSLSRSIFSIMANEIGEPKKAYDYFMDTALMDITDLQANTKDGVHTANMGGTWLGIVQGFAGMRLYADKLHFSPQLPKQWSKLAFNIQFRSSTIRVTITQSGTEYTLLAGEPVHIMHGGKAKKVR